MDVIKYLTKVYPRTKDKFTITNSTILDGGRNSFFCEYKEIKFWIRIVDNAVESEKYHKGYCPGGLYLNDTLIKINSELEKTLIDVLENINIIEDWYNEKIPEKFLGMDSIGRIEKYRVDQKISFIKSCDYIRLGKLTKRI